MSKRDTATGNFRSRWATAPLAMALILLICPRGVLAKNDGRGNCSGCHGPALTTTPVNGDMFDFGNTLVGTQKAKTFSIKNTGGNDGGQAYRLAGTFPAMPGEFTLAGTASFTNLARNASLSRTYNYKPTSRGPDNQLMTSTGTPSNYPSGVTYTLLQGSSTVTFTGRGVAPVATVDSSGADAGNVRIGDSKIARVTVRNTGDGNLSGQGAVSNLNGTASTASGAFSGTGGIIGLADNTSADFDYSFVPFVRGTQTANVTLDMSNGKPDGTNVAHQANVQLSGNGVGPEFSSSVAPGSTIDFGEAKGSVRQLLEVRNSTPDLDLGPLTDLTLLSASIGGPDKDMFSIESFTPNTVLGKLESLSLGLVFDSQGQKGEWNATLTLLTDQGAAFGAAGASFEYQLTADMAPVPEPSTLAMLLVGAGLAAVAFCRRRESIRRAATLGLGLALLFGCACPAWAVSGYTLLDLGTLGGDYSSGNAINDLGFVVGEARTSSGDVHAFLYNPLSGSPASLQDLGSFGNGNSSAKDINNSGDVVGSYESNLESRAFVIRGGTVQDLGSLARRHSVAWGINASGQVVGEYQDDSGLYRGFLLSGGSLQDLGTLGGERSSAFRVNDSGQIAGTADNVDGATHAAIYDSAVPSPSWRDLDAAGLGSSWANDINAAGYVVGEIDSQAFLFDGASVLPLGTLGGGLSTAWGLNSQGQVVGESDGRAFLYEAGAMTDLNDLIPAGSGWTLYGAWDINSSGQIVANGYDSANQIHAILLTPVPEPGTLVLVLAGVLAALGWTRRRGFGRKGPAR